MDKGRKGSLEGFPEAFQVSLLDAGGTKIPQVVKGKKGIADTENTKNKVQPCVSSGGKNVCPSLLS